MLNADKQIGYIYFDWFEMLVNKLKLIEIVRKFVYDFTCYS